VTDEQHREISILASMAKGGAAEMDPADDARKFLSDSLGVGAMQCHVSSEKYHKVVVDGGMQV
jgi:aspartate oxidase